MSESEPEDLVIRLRRSAARARDVFDPSFWNPWEEAANEIERLRGVVKRLESSAAPPDERAPTPLAFPRPIV